jgi:hypothetical protein
MGSPVALAGSLTTIICAPSVIASIRGSMSAMLPALHRSRPRLLSAPCEREGARPIPQRSWSTWRAPRARRRVRTIRSSGLESLRSRSRPPRSEENHGRRDRKRTVLGRVRQQDDLVDTQGEREEERALAEPIASPLAHDEEHHDDEASQNVERVLHVHRDGSSGARACGCPSSSLGGGQRALEGGPVERAAVRREHVLDRELEQRLQALDDLLAGCAYCF